RTHERPNPWTFVGPRELEQERFVQAHVFLFGRPWLLIGFVPVENRRRTGRTHTDWFGRGKKRSLADHQVSAAGRSRARVARIEEGRPVRSVRQVRDQRILQE